MVNLITPAERATLTRLYLLRLATVALSALASAVLVTLVLLTPSYAMLRAEAEQAGSYVQSATALAEQRAKGQSQETLQKFQEAVTLLTGASRKPSFAEILAASTNERPAGVTVSTVTVTYDAQGNAVVSLQGTARTRAALIAFANELKRTPNLTQVVVPVSNLVADVDASFSMTMKWIKPK